MPLEKIKPTSNQPAFLNGTAKTHKFNNPGEITKENLKLRPIVSTCDPFTTKQPGTWPPTYSLLLRTNTASKPPRTLPTVSVNNRTLDDDEVLVSYDVSSLFTEVLLDDTIDYIKEIYTQSKLPQLSSKLLFGVTKNNVFNFNGHLYKQIDGCGMGNPLSPVRANIFMAKVESDVLRPCNPPFYDRYVDDCVSKRKKGKPDDLLEHLNSYHPNIVLTV